VPVRLLVQLASQRLAGGEQVNHRRSFDYRDAEDPRPLELSLVGPISFLAV